MIQACRSCGAPLSTVFVDLGSMPIANAFRRAEDLAKPETSYPLRALVCDACKLVQLQDFATREAHFNADYAYFASYSASWLDHARRYVAMATARFGLDENSQVVEIASNDGYLLQYFVGRGIQALGIDPAANCAEAAREKGVETLVEFFGRQTAERLRAEGRSADLIVANNVLAHVPDLNDFGAGLAILLKPGGTITAEFPHLAELIAKGEFDTIYHEHYSYLSLMALAPLFDRHGLKVVDVERLSTHGGSLRVFAMHEKSGREAEGTVAALLEDERSAGIDQLATYADFGSKAAALKRDLLELLTGLKRSGKTIVGYGAPAKGNTLLNYCGIGADLIDFTVDRNPAKQGRYLPGSGIPVRAPEEIRAARPDYVLVLPWNIKDEIMTDWREIQNWGGRFIVPVPRPMIIAP